jgi:hypothetical protein
MWVILLNDILIGIAVIPANEHKYKLKKSQFEKESIVAK